MLEARRPRRGAPARSTRSGRAIRISPCAYLVGLLHPLVIDELDMPGYGFELVPGDRGAVRPVRGRHQHPALGRRRALRGRDPPALAPSTSTGWRDFSRGQGAGCATPSGPPAGGDLWVGKAPTIEEIDERLGGDHEARQLLFEWSMVECVENYFQDERLQMAYLGQGVIGTNASPHDRGTASIHFHHQSGRLGGSPGMWGYVKGGMGMVSFILCDIARDLGAAVADRHARWPGSSPAKGSSSREASGSRRRHRDLQRRPARHAQAARRRRRPRLEGAGRGRSPRSAARSSSTSSLKELPSFKARPGHARCPTIGARSTRRSPRTSGGRLPGRPRRASCPSRLWTELYFQTAHDPSVAPAGRAHDERLRPVRAAHLRARRLGHAGATTCKELALGSIGRFCDNIPDAVIDVQVLGPPDIEQRSRPDRRPHLPGRMPSRPTCGTTGSRPRTPMPGVFLCGACTYPGGSVIGINGRNAAMEVLGETTRVSVRAEGNGWLELSAARGGEPARRRDTSRSSPGPR